MNKSIIIFIAVLILYSCNQRGIKEQPKQIIFLKGFKLSPFLDSLFAEYARQTPNAPAYAVYIDQKTEGQEYTITFAPFKKKVNSLYGSGGISYFMYHDTVPVFLYTGLEDFVTCDSASFIKVREILPEVKKGKEFRNWDGRRKEIDFSKVWSYVHVADSSYIVKGDGEPFIKTTLLPPVIFNAPDSLQRTSK